MAVVKAQLRAEALKGGGVYLIEQKLTFAFRKLIPCPYIVAQLGISGFDTMLTEAFIDVVEGNLTIDEAIDSAGLPLLGVIPEDDDVPLSLGRGIQCLSDRGLQPGGRRRCFHLAHLLPHPRKDCQ